MPSDPDLRRINHEIAECPHCGERHVFSVLVRLRGQPVMLFGGPGGPSVLAFTCPRTQKIISAAVPDPPGLDAAVPDPPRGAPPVNEGSRKGTPRVDPVKECSGCPPSPIRPGRTICR